MKSNRRKFSRIETAAACVIQTHGGGASWQGEIKSIGFGGASCVFAAGIPLQERYELRCPGYDSHTPIAVKVRWVAPGELGQMRVGFDFELESDGCVDAVSHLLFQILQHNEGRAVPPLEPETANRKSAAHWMVAPAVKRDGTPSISAPRMAVAAF